MDIEKGDWVIIQGPSGGGKTTLALALSGYLYHFSNGDYEGSVTINGKAIEELSFSEITDQVYLVQQNPENQFCTLTVRDEIAFGLENRNVPVEIIHERIKQALEIVHGEKLIDANLLELSGGEKQKVAIATAIALKPAIIILDEPTSNLDPISSKEVFQALNQMKTLDEVTVVIIEHKIQQALCYTTHLFQLSGGKLIEQSSKNKGWNKVENHGRHAHKTLTVTKKPVLRLENFNVKRQEEIVVGIEEMVIFPGEFVALIGPNGSGKTSFMLGLLNLLASTRDVCKLENKDICLSTKTYEIARTAGYVFQNPDHQLFCESVADEAFLAPKNYGKDISKIKLGVMGMLQGFGLDDKLEAHPFNLSFGQKKRLNLASVLAYEPRLLLLDEIFIGQDEDSIHFMLEIINAYIDLHQAAVILVNHYLKPLVNIADRLVFLECGQILFDVPMKNYENELKKYEKREYLPNYC